MLHVWLASTLKRVYPNTPSFDANELTLHAARGERVSFQVVARTGADPARIEVGIDGLEGVNIRVRRVGYVPVKHLNTETPESDLEGIGHIPGLAPDPLFDETTFEAGPFETNAFWVSVAVTESAVPGQHKLQIKVNDAAPQIVELVIHKALVAERTDFPVTHWFYCDALSDHYGIPVFTKEFWPLLEKYVRNLVGHGNDTLHTPIFTPPTDGIKKPNQLLGVARQGDGYSFDWTLVRLWVEMAKRCRVKRFEWSHFFSQWGCKFALRIYEGNPSDEKLLWDPETPATSDIYRGFLDVFIPEFKAFLEREGILDASFFHISDEPHGEEALANYKAARQMMREVAPWMKFMDALSQIEFANEGLTDVPIPVLNTAPDFVAAGYPAWCYFCCGPRGEYLNRLFDTPLTKIRMSGWLFYRLRSQGFLHWGYNYWYKSQSREMIDPFTEQAGGIWPGWSTGDTFLVYPGKDGPIDSIRWEVFAESLQDYALLAACGTLPDDPLLSQIKDYADFPKTEVWISSRRQMLLDLLDRRS